MKEYGGIEIYIHCDAAECGAEQRVHDDALPDGWSRRGKLTYCPTHDHRRQR
jgi:hypothetical protein